jgi:transposase
MKRKTIERTDARAARALTVPDPAPPKPASKAKENGKPENSGSKLTMAEQIKLAGLETTIGSGLASFVEVGRSLIQINEDRLYREGDGTFEEYCERRWDLSRQHGYRLIHAAKCFDKLQSSFPKGAHLPRNESQLRPLEHLKPNFWVKAWKQALNDSSGVRITAEVVKKVVRQLGGKSKPPKPTARKKVRAQVPTKTVEKIVEVVRLALGTPEPSVEQLRKVLKQIQKELKRFIIGQTS